MSHIIKVDIDKDDIARGFADDFRNELDKVVYGDFKLTIDFNANRLVINFQSNCGTADDLEDIVINIEDELRA